MESDGNDNIRLLPVSDPSNSPADPQRTIPRKPVPKMSVNDMSYEPHRPIGSTPEVSDYKNEPKRPHNWPSMPTRLGRRDGMFIAVFTTDLIITFVPVVFLGEHFY